MFGLVNIFLGSPICGAYTYEMALMWFVMCLAHLNSWLIWWEGRRLGFSRL